ncbi:MAG: hypothetical protein M1835_007565 [Candelina submexicana]|nr:MAG: hypothetical protein M1835_007565 [Candelina submexicana]
MVVALCISNRISDRETDFGWQSPLKPYEIEGVTAMTISFNPGNLTNREISEGMCAFGSDSFHDLLDAYKNWIKAPEIYQSLPLDVTNSEGCEPLYSSLSGAINESIPEDPETRWDEIDIKASDPGPCPPLNRDEWIDKPVDGATTEDNLMQFVHGGVDSDGIGHKALGNASLSSRLREVFLEAYPSNCTLESPCEPPQDCKQVGTRFTASPSKPIRRSTWAYLVLISIANINQQLFNQFEALQSAAIEGSLAGFNIDDYFPKPGKHLALKNLITGLSTVLAAVSGFIPFLGPGLGAFEVGGATLGTLGAVASGAGTYFDRSLQNNIDRSDPNVAQKRFAPTVRQIFRVF